MLFCGMRGEDTESATVVGRGEIKGLHKPALGDPLNPTFVIMPHLGPWPYFSPCYAESHSSPLLSDKCSPRGLKVYMYILRARFQGIT